jgi:hypothetical protein
MRLRTCNHRFLAGGQWFGAAGAGVSLTVRLAWLLVEELYDLVMVDGRKDDL